MPNARATGMNCARRFRHWWAVRRTGMSSQHRSIRRWRAWSRAASSSKTASSRMRARRSESSALTTPGRQALQEWFENGIEPEHQHDEFFLKLMIGLVSGVADPYRLIHTQQRMAPVPGAARPDGTSQPGRSRPRIGQHPAFLYNDHARGSRYTLARHDRGTARRDSAPAVAGAGSQGAGRPRKICAVRLKDNGHHRWS